MELRLATPPLSSAANTESFQPEEVERLLESAHYEHKPDAARKLLDLITAMNRVRLDPEVREASLELIVPEARQLCARLRQPWREGREAAGEAARQGLRLSLDLANEVGYGYKHLLMASSARRFGLWGGKPEATLVRATLHALGNILMFSYETYLPTPAGLWHEVHQLYRYGREHGLLKEANERGHTVETEYKRCLLLAAIDPYHLERGDLVWLLPYLNSHAEEIGLTEPVGGAGDEPGLFRLLLDSDKPPMPLTEAIQPDEPGLELMLDTRALPTLIQKNLIRLEMGEAPSRLGLPPDAPVAKYLSALARIAATWEGKRHRKFSRRTAQDAQVAVLAGVRSVCEGMTQSGDAGRASVCTPVNDSPSGIALQLKSGDMPVSVGELVAMRSGVQPDWNVGVVRWVKGGGIGQTQFGVQWLAPGAVPASLSLPQERKGHPGYPALLLRNPDPDRGVDRMIAQPGLYREQRHYRIVRLLEKSGIDPSRTILELTERESVEDLERLLRTVAACRAAGMRIAADDVGAGNAGLRLLSQMQFDIVKIDLSLVQGGPQLKQSLAVISTLQELAQRWGAWVIAEGVETGEQLQLVRDLGISAAQGYLLGRPGHSLDLPAVDLASLVTRQDWLRHLGMVARPMTAGAVPGS